MLSHSSQAKAFDNTEMASPGGSGPLGDYAENWAALLDLFISVGVCQGALAIAKGPGVPDGGRGRAVDPGQTTLAHACCMKLSTGHRQ